MATILHHGTHLRSLRRPSPRTVTAQQVTAQDTTGEPSAAASVVPVLLSFAGLFGLAIVAALCGRRVLEILGALLVAG